MNKDPAPISLLPHQTPA